MAEQKTGVDRRTVDLSEFPDLVVIYLGMRARNLRGFGKLLQTGRQIRAGFAQDPDGQPRVRAVVPEDALVEEAQVANVVRGRGRCSRAKLGGGMEKVDYDARLHAVYAAGRQMSLDALQTWMEAFARHLPETRPLVWLDLGSGTGRMTPSLASAFGGPAHGVEPSDKMRAQALAHARHPAVTYAAGSAEQIPLPDASCDAALLFFVWHHVVDREGAAQELRRVVKPGGMLFVQANFSDRMPDVWWFRVVPEWRKVDTAQFRSAEEVKRDFAGAGWTLVARDEVTWLRSMNVAEDFERLKLRAVSLFEHVSEEVAQAGFAGIEAALPSLGDGPQYETSGLLVFQR